MTESGRPDTKEATFGESGEPLEEAVSQGPVVAHVRVAAPLYEEERERLQKALERYAGCPVALDIQVDPSILGGIWVRIGDYVIDGSLKAKLETLDRELRARCQQLLISGEVECVGGEAEATPTPSADVQERVQIHETLLKTLKEQIRAFRYPVRVKSVGTVLEVGDSIVRASGLGDVMMGEVVRFEDGTMGMALNIEAETVSIIVMGPHEGIIEGSLVEATGQVLSVPVGPALLGRVVNALGEPIDKQGPIHTDRMRVVEQVAKGIIERAPVDTPLYTGIKAIDALVPIGRGQRELIIGDRQTGKTTLAIDAIINQSRYDVLCVYVAIGQKLADIARVVDTLRRHGAMEHTIVVVAEASAPAALQYLAPYAGCAMAEAFVEEGRDTLIVYDDLTKHAWAYRQLSLLLRRPPGREAFPGDIFYLHSRLLERAGRFAPSAGGGSMTALPIVETQMGDLAAYIPTNIISITDGQVFLETGLFHSGVRPAVNAGLSVSRVGGAAQIPAMRQVAGQMRLDLAQYRELVTFTQFGTELDPASQATIDRGARLLELLKQNQHVLVEPQDQIALFFAATNGYLNDVPLDAIADFEAQFLRYLQQEAQSVRSAILFERRITPDIDQALRDALERFRSTVWSHRD